MSCLLRWAFPTEEDRENWRIFTRTQTSRKS